jgi:predicted membrane protein
MKTLGWIINLLIILFCLAIASPFICLFLFYGAIIAIIFIPVFAYMLLASWISFKKLKSELSTLYNKYENHEISDDEFKIQLQKLKKKWHEFYDNESLEIKFDNDKGETK